MATILFQNKLIIFFYIQFSCEKINTFNIAQSNWLQ